MWDKTLKRPGRLRGYSFKREWVRETTVGPKDLIMPLFICGGKSRREKIDSMPGVFRHSIDRALEEIAAARGMGINAVLIFGVPPRRDDTGRIASEKRGVVQRAVRAIKRRFSDIIVITDVCLCNYTRHGHCGILKNKKIDNKLTLEALSAIALSHASSGADIVAPSAMADGQVYAIRKQLDKDGFYDTAILSYSAKYASSFYGPFREALGSAPAFGDRRGYQLDYSNTREAMREVETDITEGADIVMVKPALAYLDIIKTARDRFDVPLAAYNVSGEYSMLKAYAKYGIPEKDIVLEALTCIKRAGADFIITYYAKEAARWLR